MRRLVGWVGGAVGGAAVYRWLRRRSQVEAPVAESESAESDERADELRARLAETRASDEPSPAEPDEPPEAVEERRQRVHDEGRAALDEMKSDGSA